jgi:DNA invertase Pin-like site-specific DNA recombinase
MSRKSRKNFTDAPAQKATKTMYNVGAYIRLSVVDRKQKGDSIETQQAIVKAYIMEHGDDMVLQETYIDNGLSGQSFARPDFQRMIGDMESGKINCCVVKDLSRLGRNAIDTGYYIDKYFPTQGIRFVAVNDGYDSIEMQNGSLTVSLMNMLNENYALEVGRKIRATFQVIREKGGYLGTVAPYGYLKSADDCHRLIRDDYAAPIVQKIFEMAAGGQSVSAILEWLNYNQFLTPSHYMHSLGISGKKRAGNNIHWSSSTVYMVLRNRIYCGDMVQGKSMQRNLVCKTLPESEWVVTVNTHEAIISREVFELVQKRYVKSYLSISKYTTQKTESIFIRKIYCGDCGSLMSRQRRSEDTYRFVCLSRRMYSKYACTGVGIAESSLKQKLLKLLCLYTPLSTESDNPASKDGSAADTIKIELANAQSELDNNEHFFRSLYESLVCGDISETEYKELKKGYEEKMASLYELKVRLQDEAQKYAEQENKLSMVRGSIQKISGLPELDTEIVGSLIDKIYIYKGGLIRVKFSFMENEVCSGEGLAHE